MFDDDEYFLDDEELAEDNRLTISDSARMDLLNSIIKSAQDMKDNLKFNEQSDAEHNLEMITNYVDCLIKVSQVDLEDLSEEEAEELIDKILRSTTELTFNNIDEVLPDVEPEAEMNDDNSDDGDSTDW